MAEKKIKILHLITGLNVGGAEMMLFKTIARLDKFEHVVCALENRGLLADELEFIGVKTCFLPGGKHFSLKAILGFRRVIREEKPDILSTRLIHADIFGRIFGRIFGIKKIYCIAESVLDDKKYALFFFFERITSFLVTRYAAVSVAVRDCYMEKAKIPENKIEVIYNGVDLNSFKNLPNIQAARTQLGFNSSDILVGYAAKFRPERNHAVLIRVLKKVVDAIPDAKLIFAGEGPEEPGLKHLAEIMGLNERVLFLGMRNDVPLLLRSLDIFVSPSSYEGMSVAILEAMAAGLPIVASDIAPNRELIENEKDGFLVPPLDEVTMADKIIQLANNSALRADFSSKVRNKSGNFSIENTVAKLTQLYAH